MRSVTQLALVLSVAFGTALSGRDPQNPTAQQNPQIPVFRTGVDVVRVDVYPRRRDRIVEGLTKEDFQLTEDGVRQVIETFEYIPIAMDRDLEPLDPRSASEARRMAEDPRNRVFVFYLDTYEIDMEGSHRAREPLLGFLQRNMGPRDLFAWMTPRHSPEFLEFTRATQDLATLMTIVKPWGEKDQPVEDPEEMKLQGCAPSDGGPNWLVRAKRTLEMHEDLKELIMRLGALRQERKNLVILGERWQNTIGDPFRRDPSSPSIQRSASFDQGGPGSFVPKSPVLDSIRLCSQVSTYLKGKRVFDTAQELIDLARRNNVALYFVSLAPKVLSNFSVARSIAEDTDGRSMVSNDTFGSLQQVLEHQTGFYMLGYRSTAGEAGKKARTVRVKTTRDGVDMDVRRIYEPPPPEFVAARSSPKPPVERSEIEKAVDRLPPVRADAEVVMQALQREHGIDVTLEVAGRLTATAPWSGGGTVTVSLRGEGGAVLETGKGTFAAGERSTRVLVPAADVAKVTRVAAVLEHASGATLGDSVVPEAPPAGPIGAPVFYRAGSLPRLPYLPAAERSFARTERVRVEWPLAAPVVDAKIRLLNSSGAELATDVVVSAIDGPPRVFRADLRILSLAPGTYVIEATGATDGKPVRLLTAIRVTR